MGLVKVRISSNCPNCLRLITPTSPTTLTFHCAPFGFYWSMLDTRRCRPRAVKPAQACFIEVWRGSSERRSLSRGVPDRALDLWYKCLFPPLFLPALLTEGKLLVFSGLWDSIKAAKVLELRKTIGLVAVCNARVKLFIVKHINWLKCSSRCC